jgi:macrolide transport system ATP-binding/permease protein
VGEIIGDLRYTLRGMLREPAFTLVAVATIALGIGVNSTIFSLVNAVLLRPLAVERPGELVNIYGHAATSTAHDASSYPNFLDYRSATTTLSDMMAYTNFFASLSIDGSSELVAGEIVSQDYFRVLGVRPALGRDFSPDEFQVPGSGPVVILSHPFWHSRFGGDPSVIGQTFRMNGVVYTVIGIAPRGFGGMLRGINSQMWVPLSMVDAVEPLGNRRVTMHGTGGSLLDERGMHFLWAGGRMKPGVHVAQVRAELTGIAAALATTYPESNELERVEVVALNDVLVNPDLDGALAPAGLVLLGAVGLVLLVACANLANMMLARASGRRREFAVRLSLGATRPRLIRQLLVESMTLAMAGGAIAMLLAYGLAGLIAQLRPPLPLDISLDVAPDWRVLLFTLCVAAATGVLFGLLPALRASRPDLLPALRESGHGQAPRGRRLALRDSLVVAQVAVSVVLLVCGALLVRSLAVGSRADLGYDVDRTAQISLSTDMNGYSPAQAGPFLELAKLRLLEVPGVEAVGTASRTPLSLNNNGFGLFIDGRQNSAHDAPYMVDGASIDEDYFRALGLRVVAGRGIEAADRDERRRVAVLTRAAATRFWPGEDAVGREFRTSWDGRPWTVVGVVEDYRVNTPGEAPQAYLHLPLSRESTFANFIVQTRTGAAGMVPLLEQQLRAIDPELVFLETGALRKLADVRLFPLRAGAWLIGAFGILALLLAAVGIYGVISYSVGQRTREIGVRKALGATTGSVLGMVLRQGMLLVVVGAAMGAVLAAVSARLLSSVLFVGSFDLISFGAAAMVLAAVAAFANWIPARRAASVEPMVVLRSQ